MTRHAKRYTESGREYVRLPASEYDRLIERLEDEEDARDVREARAYLAAGEETFPSEMVYALVDASSPGERLAIWRKHRGMTSIALGRAAGVTGQAISMIEANKRNPAVPVLRKIAHALRCDIGNLI